MLLFDLLQEVIFLKTPSVTGSHAEMQIERKMKLIF